MRGRIIVQFAKALHYQGFNMNSYSEESRFVVTALICLLASTSVSADANVSGQQLMENSALQVAIGEASDPTLRWEEYLERHGLVEGFNKKGSKVFFIAVGDSAVGKPLKNRGFITSRTVAFNKAVLLAKSALAESVGAEVSSERGLEMFEEGGEVAPGLGRVQNHLSIMDKARTLIDAELDNQIKKYDPNWDGTGLSEEQKRDKLAIQTEKYTENLAQNAQLFLQGAAPIFNAEGPSGDDYLVVVGIVWSPVMTRIAEAMYNPSAKAPKGKPGRSVKDRVASLLAADSTLNGINATMGVRVWRNEDGERVVVSFAAESGLGSSAIAKKKSALRARTQIAQFISENITSDGILGGDETTVYFDDGEMEAFDQTSFSQKIEATARRVCLQGVAPVKFWKGSHPNSGQKMVVHVLAWTPSSQVQAENALVIAGADVGGTCSGIAETATPPKTPDAVGGMKGAESSSDDF